MQLSEKILAQARGIAEQMITDGAKMRLVPAESEGIHVATSLELIVPLGGFELNGHYFFVGLPKVADNLNLD